MKIAIQSSLATLLKLGRKAKTGFEKVVAQYPDKITYDKVEVIPAGCQCVTVTGEDVLQQLLDEIESALKGGHKIELLLVVPKGMIPALSKFM